MEFSAIWKGALIGGILGFIIGATSISFLSVHSALNSSFEYAPSPLYYIQMVSFLSLIGLLIGTFIGSIIGQLIVSRANKNFWKSAPCWMRGGLIGTGLLILDFIFIFVIENRMSNGCMDCFYPRGLLIVLGYFIFPFNLVVINIIIGAIVGKFKEQDP